MFTRNSRDVALEISKHQCKTMKSMSYWYEERLSILWQKFVLCHVVSGGVGHELIFKQKLRMLPRLNFDNTTISIAVYVQKRIICSLTKHPMAVVILWKWKCCVGNINLECWSHNTFWKNNLATLVPKTRIL